MFFKGFTLAIQGKKEDEGGYVRMSHEEEYAVVMSNTTGKLTDAELIIDGKSVGTFRLDGHDTIRIERPADEAKKFTFLKLGTSEAVQAKLDQVSAQDLGLVQVRFKPERQYQAIRKPLHHTNSYTRSWGGAGASSAGISSGSLNSTELTSGPISFTADTSAGGTGLGADSNQSFTTVTPLQTQESDWVQISLRLTEGKYTPMSQTRVPDPIT